MVVLVPVVFGILQVALVLYVHNTLASAASEGARLAATRDRGPADGAALTRAQIEGAVSGKFAQDVSAQTDRGHGRGHGARAGAGARASAAPASS